MESYSGFASNALGVLTRFTPQWVNDTCASVFQGKKVDVVHEGHALEEEEKAPDFTGSVKMIIESIHVRGSIRKATDKTWFLRAMYLALMANGHAKKANIIMNGLLNNNPHAADSIAFRKKDGDLDDISLAADISVRGKYIPPDLFGEDRSVKLQIIEEAAKRRTLVDSLRGPWLINHIIGNIYSQRDDLKASVNTLASIVFNATTKNWKVTCNLLANSEELCPIMKVTLLGFLVLQMWDLGEKKAAQEVLECCLEITPNPIVEVEDEEPFRSNQDIYVYRWQAYFSGILAVLNLEKNYGFLHQYRMSMPSFLGGYSEDAFIKRIEMFNYWNDFAKTISEGELSADKTIDLNAEKASTSLAWSLFQEL